MVLFLLHNYFHTFEKASIAAKTTENTTEMSNEEIKKKVFIRNVRKGAMIKLLADTFEVIQLDVAKDRSNSPDVFLGKGVLKIRSRSREHLCRNVISR